MPTKYCTKDEICQDQSMEESHCKDFTCENIRHYCKIECLFCLKNNNNKESSEE